MQVPKIFVRSTKFLGKALLGLLVVLLLLLAIVHLPPVQKQITHKLANYLSSKIESKVDIQAITFSLLGNVAIADLTVWDPTGTKIFSAQKIEVASSIYKLVAGDFIFDQVHIKGAEFKLIQHEAGLNIQFIIDAFKSDEKPITSSTPTILQFRQVELGNVVFGFTSAVRGVSVDINLGMLTSREFELTTYPLAIKADQVFIEQTLVNTLTALPANQNITPSTSKVLLSPDFGTGIVFEINQLALQDDNFSFHQGQVLETQKFDPAHITLKNIQLNLADLLIHEDTLSADLQGLAVQLPGFAVTHAKAELQMNRSQLNLSNLHFASGTNELRAELTVPNIKSAKEAGQVKTEIVLQSKINPNDLAYFFNESLMSQFSAWGPTELSVEGNYTLGNGKIKTLNLKTGSSQLHVNGFVNDVWDLKQISWKDLVVDASIGSDFKRILTPYLQTIKLPPSIALHLKSSGNPAKLSAAATAFTTWGDVKATGLATRLTNNLDIDINVTGEKVDVGKWMNLSWIGPMNLSAQAKGIIGADQRIEINGLINTLEMMDEAIHHIAFQSTTRKDSATVMVSIDDPNYRSEINSEISFKGPLAFTNHIQLDSFKLGRLVQRDSTLFISGYTKSQLLIDSSSLESFLVGKDMLFHKQAIEYSLDTLFIHALLSPTKSDFTYYTNYAKTNVVSNFDFRDASDVIQTWTENILKGIDTRTHPTGNRVANFTIDLDNASFLKLLGMDVDDFSSLTAAGVFDEQKQIATLQATSGKFKGYGISLDTMHANLRSHRDSIGTRIVATNLLYNSIQLGNLDFEMLKKGDTALSNLLVTNDSITTLGLRTHLVRSDSGVFVYPDKLRAFDNDYSIDPKNPVYLKKDNLVFNHFQVNRDDMQINLDGDLNTFGISLKNVDLTPLNLLLSPDTTVINKGYLTGKVSYVRNQQIDLNAEIDSLVLYNSSPLTLSATAVSEGNQVPFEFLLTNTTNKIDLKGLYHTASKEVDANLLLDVNNLEIFDFLVAGAIEQMKGTIKGEAAINGPIQKPALKGQVQFLDVELTTVNPKLTFNVPDDRITLDNSSLLFDNFKLYDKDHHPLIIHGNLTSKDYESFQYDLQINSDQYSLINNPDSTRGKLRGLLVIDSDIKLTGNEKDKNVKANLTIKDATDLTFVASRGDIELLKAEGIVDFVDPALALDSVLEQSSSLYDSLIASLPDFNLNSTLAVEENAVLRVIIDEQSGDYIEASGGATLELGYDRTGNLNLSGNYTIRKGVYRLSFYDLVKKNFNLVPGSSINWSGNPSTGDLNIKAEHTVASNSIGLIGHEIGENEKSIYKRSLDYAVGINILGTLEKPIISFSLDLPQNEKVNYPVLANKLDRLRQPEYASELNKQVFGLLVLGGFLPESSADVNSNVIATTALSNSVNNLLASQLNRFANQYIKGVNIDVGIQSFSDYSAPGGKTQTAMDFRVSKRLMNDRLAFEIGGDFDINQDQSGGNTGKNYRGDIAIIYDLTGNGDKQLKLFNNETYDIIYQEIRNTGISLIFIREFESKKKEKKDQ